MGRPTKLTEDVHHRLVQLLRAGNYRATAARTVGVHESTLASWIERGEADAEAGRRSPYARLFKAITKALGEAEATSVARVRMAAEHDWRAAAWWLERMYPDRWGQRQRLEHAGTFRHEQTIPLIEIKDTERAAEVARILAEVGAVGADT